MPSATGRPISSRRNLRVFQRIQLAGRGCAWAGSWNRTGRSGGPVGAGFVRLFVVCRLCRFVRGLLRHDEVSASARACADASLVTSAFRWRGCPESWQDLALISVRRFFLVAAHQIQVELRNPHAGQLAKPFMMRFNRPNDTKTVHHLVRYEIGIVTLYDAVVQIVVTPAVLHVRSERRRQV